MDPFDLFANAPQRSRSGDAARHLAALLRWVGVRRIVLGAGIAVLAAVGGWWLLHSPAPSVERSIPYTSASTTVPATVPVTATLDAADGRAVPGTSLPAVVIVHVAGAVRSPGLVRLPGGSRVDDAVRAAGGALPDADPNLLNLAAFLSDGQRVYVPRAGEAVGGGVTGAAESGPALRIDLNTASAEELDRLPGVGPSLARMIVAYRETNGPFRRIEDLLKVPGIGTSKLALFRPLAAV